MNINPYTFRVAGVAMLAGTLLMLIGAFSTAYFRRMPPTDPLEQLQVIAGDAVGWTAQAIVFPVAMAVVAVSFGLTAMQLPGSPARWLAIAATTLSAVACLLWIPISVARLQLLDAAPALIASFDANSPPRVMIGNQGLFWLYTALTLASISLLGVALALGGVLPRMGWIVAGLAALCLVVVAPLVLRDWPPFMSYLLTLALAVALLRWHAPA